MNMIRKRTFGEIAKVLFLCLKTIYIIKINLKKFKNNIDKVKKF